MLEQIVKGIDACRAYAAGSGLELAGVGIGTPGVVSADGRTVLGGAENIAGWENLPLASRIEAATGLGDRGRERRQRHGAGRDALRGGPGATDVVFVTVGTGIGCGC